jgi:hypothetical protein
MWAVYENANHSVEICSSIATKPARFVSPPLCTLPTSVCAGMQIHVCIRPRPKAPNLVLDNHTRFVRARFVRHVRYNESHATSITDWQIACVRTTFVPPASTQSDSMPPACPAAAEDTIGIVYCPSKMRVALGTARDSQIGPVSSSVKLTGVCVITLATMMWRHVSAQSSRQIATRGSYGSATVRAGNEDLSRSVGTASVIGAWEPQAVCQRR